MSHFEIKLATLLMISSSLSGLSSDEGMSIMPLSLFFIRNNIFFIGYKTKLLLITFSS